MWRKFINFFAILFCGCSAVVREGQPAEPSQAPAGLVPPVRRATTVQSLVVPPAPKPVVRNLMLEWENKGSDGNWSVIQSSANITTWETIGKVRLAETNTFPITNNFESLRTFRVYNSYD